MVTAELQKENVEVDRWLPVHGQVLAEAVPSGAEILINPAGRAAMRISVDSLCAVPEEVSGSDG
ncbi:hypothetical protein ACIG56_03915 [Nocardia fusca]|uniref:hypothetical protein n=1 Tax=Nocardia fusca TaxID=941183 RepID=UPI0037C4FF03